MHDLAVYMKEGLPFAQDSSLESTFFDIISSNIDEDLLINQSAVCLSLKILMSIIRAG